MTKEMLTFLVLIQLFESCLASNGLFPSVFNLAESAAIIANATCGDQTTEVYCHLDVSGSIAPVNQNCGICDATESSKAHPIGMVIDGQPETFWQSPSLQFGPNNNFVTITVDLKRVFQVGYILLQSAHSPRPGNWILERSLDGVEWAPWQFFAMTDEECWHAFGVEPRQGKPTYRYDDEVICTSYFSKLEPVADGEVHISLVNGRPGASGPSRTLTEFTLARYVRLRFRKLRILAKDQALVDGFAYPDATVLRRYFYSLRDVTIGGQCPCNGHASECKVIPSTMDYICKCKHNTCGSLCNQCCPMYNQKLWRPGKFITANACERCQCHGHADECFFDPQVEAERRSMDTDGKYQGGGVCVGCRHYTDGINCEYCKKGYYRPLDVSQFDNRPCRPCQCSSSYLVGSTGTCYNNADAEKLTGVEPGHCVCKEGYAGPRCDQCAPGYHQYPNCVPCPCTLAGTLNGACGGLCQCKSNVEGRRCDRCKRGFFALHEAHSEGCLECFCNGITDRCELAQLGIETLQHNEGWKVTDLRGRVLTEPYWSTVTHGVTIAEEDMRGLQTYYWQAPEEYIGNRLVTYGLKLKILTSWHTGRGDTAGTATLGPDIVLESTTGQVIGCGALRYKGQVNASIAVEMTETAGWYHIPPTVFDIEARSFTGEDPEFIGRPVTKVEFMQVIESISRLLVRAKYHTDQLEGTLHTASMEFGSQNSLNLRKTIAVEQCLCPQGYKGLSCESCDYGYARQNNSLYNGQCIKCDCNGHAATCDPFTFRCGTCEHNTEGQHCERCAPGFYGNPLLGTPGDCKPCKCPLDIASNNFSPTCEQATAGYDRYSIVPQGYICNACPRGYAGPHCERCENGYFGNPLEVGDFCRPCHCNGNANIYVPNWCDHRTGQCLQCLGNTGGWHCGECLKGYYGNALSGQCKACRCNQYGSLSSDCDPITGQCLCKDKYVGRTCSQCKDGFGNVAAGCRQCGCHSTGSQSEVCHADSGQCQCHPGVTGLTCDYCLPFHFGFYNGKPGCQACDCHPKGSTAQQCNDSSGQCSCQPRVTGKKCDKCIFGYWNVNSGVGCEQCNCDPMGSYDTDCDDLNGQCRCKPGVGGLDCSYCLPGFWGFSPQGCTKCFPCEQPGHICDPDTGRCICPALTIGLACESCAPGTWSYHPYKGCKYCQCHPRGSVSEQCDLDTGACRCLEGFEGEKCDRCSQGHYKFPHCWPCNCDIHGTESSSCSNDTCSCDSSGGCHCKALVEGKKCASCRPGAFSLSEFNPEGCMKCFCFGRTNECHQADYVWSQITSSEAKRQVVITRGETQMEVSFGLLVIPGNQGNVVIGVTRLFVTPLYWSLPNSYIGDKMTSYNGYLRFTISVTGSEKQIDSNLEHPLVQLQSANKRIILEHFPQKLSSSGRYEVQLHENNWVQKGTRQPISREILMVALKSVERILVRATDFTGSTAAYLHGVTLDVAVRRQESDRRAKALGIEQCHCPIKYNGTSCQDPGTGYYRWYSEYHMTTTTYLDFGGDVKACQCNGRADRCDPENGSCLDCRENTTGSACDLCAPGFYGNPLIGDKCQPCQCPNADHNHAVTCSVDSGGQFMCQCTEGYTGPQCDRCDYGYFGNSKEDGCVPCACNPLGSLSDQCDQETGQCFCVRGVGGRDCSQCAARQVLVQGGVCKDCKHACIAPLLDTMEQLVSYYQMANVSDIDTDPILRLKKFQSQATSYNISIMEAGKTKEILDGETTKLMALRPHAELTMLEVKKYKKAAFKQDQDAQDLQKDTTTVQTEADYLLRDIEDITRRLKNYGINSMPQISINRALNEARDILATIKGRGYAQADIVARTELSYARQSLNTIRELLFDRNILQHQSNTIDTIEVVTNDLLKYLNTAMDHTREAMLANQRHHDTLVQAQTSCSNTDQMLVESSEMLKSGQDLLTSAKVTTQEARLSFNELRLLYERLAKWMNYLEGNESRLGSLVQDYKSRYVEPCEKHTEKLLQEAANILALFDSDRGLGAERTLEAANAYQRIIKTVLQASRAAEEAFTLSIGLIETVNRKNEAGYDLYAQADVGRVKSRDLRQEAEGLRQNSREMQVQMEELILRWQSYILLVNKRHDDLASVERELDRLQIVSVLAEDAVRQSEEALRQATTVHQSVMEIFEKITQDLRSETREMQSFSPEELGNIPRKLTEARRHLQQVDKQATYLSHRLVDIDEVSRRLSSQISDVKKKLAMARHAAESVKISITNQRSDHPEATKWGCSRSYRVNLTSSLSTSLSLVYALTDVEAKDGLLVYLPSGDPDKSEDKRDFMAIEMIDRRIRFLWNNGAGTKAIWHNTTIQVSGDSHEDLKWYKITADRVGNIGRLNVRLVKRTFVGLEDNRWVVGESLSSAHVLNLHRQDLLYIGSGAVPDNLMSSELMSQGKFTGVLYHLEVDGRIIGLWNFVTSAGCRETHSGVAQESHGSCYTFRGDGYAMQRGIRRYDPRYLSLSLEFKSFDSNALIFFAINEYSKQHILLELRDGRLYMELNYGPEKQLAFLSSNTYNGGNWVQAEVARATRNNVETGVLRVTLNGVREDLMDTISLPSGVVFQMQDCIIFFGGIPPMYQDVVGSGQRLHRRTWNSFLGQLRAITISNPGSNSLINPLYTQRFSANPYYGVESDCKGHLVKDGSFNGEAYIKVPFQIPTSQATMGFAFQTFTTNGLLMLTNFNTSSRHFFSVSLVDGQLFFKFSSPAFEFMSKEPYNDGKYHTVAITRVAQDLKIYVDDDLLSQTPDSSSSFNNEQQHGGLFIGGLPYLLRDKIEKKRSAGSVNGLVGSISDVIFIDDLSVRVVDMNKPIAIERARVGRLMYFPQNDWEQSFSTIQISTTSSRFQTSFSTSLTQSDSPCSDAVSLDASKQSRLSLSLPKRRRLHLKLQMLAAKKGGLIAALPLTRRGSDKMMVLLATSGNLMEMKLMDERGKIRSSVECSLVRHWSWIEIELHFDNGQVVLSVEREMKGSIDLPRKTRLDGSIFFGSLPLDWSQIAIDNQEFSGCLNGLKINGFEQDFWEPKVSKINVEQCSTICS